MIQSGHDLAQWVRSSLASQRPRLTRENLIQEENTDQILSDLAEHATNPAAAI
jgi:ferritin-like metal-binding protein YciE